MNGKELNIASNVIPGYRVKIVQVLDYAIKMNNPGFLLDTIQLNPGDQWHYSWRFDTDEPTVKKFAMDKLQAILPQLATVDLKALELEAGTYNLIGRIDRTGFSISPYPSTTYTQVYYYNPVELPSAIMYDWNNNGVSIGSETFLDLEQIGFTSTRDMLEYIVKNIMGSYELYHDGTYILGDRWFALGTKYEGADTYELNITQTIYSDDPIKMYALILEKL